MIKLWRGKHQNDKLSATSSKIIDTFSKGKDNSVMTTVIR